MSRSVVSLCLLVSGILPLTGRNVALQAENTSPIISNISFSASASTIAVTWQTVVVSSSSVQCGLANGSWTISGVDNGTQTSVTKHSGIAAGLSPSTQYYCELQSVSTDGLITTSVITAATTALPSSTPVTGLTVESFTPYNSHGSQMSGDTYYNCVSDDNYSYLTLNDSNGFGLVTPSGANQMLAKLTSEFPVTGVNVNFMPAYGVEEAHAGSDNAVAKASGLYCLGGNIYMITGRVGPYNGQGGVEHLSAQIIKSPDHGLTWDNYQNPNQYLAAGNMTNPANAAMFGSKTRFGASSFVMYGVDDGSLGYRVDNSDAYVYVSGNDGLWDNGNALYLARVPRAKLANLNPGDIEYYLGGDGTYDQAWSGSVSNAKPTLASTGRISQPAMQYVPSLNRYVLFEWYFPNSIQTSQSNSAYTQWITYEAPHPWGPWTLVDSRSWPTQGYYNPVPLQRTALKGTSLTLLSTGNYNANWTGYPNLPTTFTYQMFTTPVQLLTDSATLDTYAGPLDSPNMPSPVAAFSLRRLSHAYTGSALRVLRWPDAAQMDIAFNPSGDLDLTALENFCGSATCSVAAWYSQVNSSGVATQTVASKQPLIMQNGQLMTKGNLNRPSLLWASGSAGFEAPAALGGSQAEAVLIGSLDPATPAWGVLLEAWDGTSNGGTSSATNADLFLRHSSLNALSSVRKGAEVDSSLTSTGKLFWADAQFTGSQMNLYLNANPAVSGPYLGAFGSKSLVIGSADDGSSTYAMRGNVSELLVFATNLGAVNGSSIYSNQQSYYGW